MGVLKSKVFRDIWSHKGRTLQIVLIIGLSAGAIGMIMSTRSVFIPGMQDIWRSMNPAMINIYTGYVSDDELYVLKDIAGITEIEGKSSTYIEWRKSPEEDWRQAGLTTRPDYENQILNQLELVNGQWPEGETLAVGQDAESFFGISPGETITIKLNDREMQVSLVGTVYDQLVQPAFLGGMAQLYASSDLYENFVGVYGYNQILLSAAVYDEEEVGLLADNVQEKLEKQGYDSGRLIEDPNKHLFQDQMDGIFLVLSVLGFFSLALGLLLVYNTVNVLIAQQVDQIGVMKAVGARTWQILRLYFVMVLIYGFLALAVALPMAVFGSNAIMTWLSTSLGAETFSFEVSPSALYLMVFLTLVAPVLASLVPIFAGSRITVREAISTYGLTIKPGLLERMLNSGRHISRLMLITISNTFRHKRRVILIEIGLVLSGVMFMTVVAVQDSIQYTISDVLLSIMNADITMVFNQPQRMEYIEELTLARSDIKAVEMWGLTSAEIRPAGQEESDDAESVQLFGVPLPTQLYGARIRAGRWLNPTDTYAIVVDQELAEELDVDVGDWVTIKYGEHRETDWQIVGLSFFPLISDISNVPRDVLMRDLGFVGRGQAVFIQTIDNSPANQTVVAKDLREFYKSKGIDVNPVRGIFGYGDTRAETASAIVGQINFLLILLGVMAVVIGAVGSIALSGALSLSVMERTREIGVMRAIGASSWTISRLFIGEGLILGWLSWLIALPLSIPAGKLMVQAIGTALQSELFYNFEPRGALIWLGIITVLSIIASWLPARSATRISVRESLAYQ